MKVFRRKFVGQRIVVVLHIRTAIGRPLCNTTLDGEWITLNYQPKWKDRLCRMCSHLKQQGHLK
jgi:hypothetical protein